MGEGAPLRLPITVTQRGTASAYLMQARSEQGGDYKDRYLVSFSRHSHGHEFLQAANYCKEMLQTPDATIRTKAELVAWHKADAPDED